MKSKNDISPDVRLAYDHLALHYREYSLQKINYIHSVDHIVEKNCNNQHHIILDFGCGDGERGSELYKKINASYLVQADISSKMLAKCSERGVANELWDVSDLSTIQPTKKFDLILCLWNVIGHIQTFEERVKTIQWLKESLACSGKIFFDVNNRHYKGYGTFRTMYRRIIDFLNPNYSRGDVNFSWKINDETIPIVGHLFTFCEIEDMCNKAGLRIDNWWAIDYKSGVVSKNCNFGQLLFMTSIKK